MEPLLTTRLNVFELPVLYRNKLKMLSSKKTKSNNGTIYKYKKNRETTTALMVLRDCQKNCIFPDFRLTGFQK